MNSHKHARLTPKGRALLVSRVVDQGWTVALASEAAGVSRRTGFKWLARFKAEGEVGLIDRSSRPLRSPRALTPQEQGELEGMRRRRWPLWRIASQAGRGVATVSRCMRRLGLSRLKSTGAAAADRSLRACGSRRTAAHRHEETRPHRRRRSPHHRRPDQEPQPRHRLGHGAPGDRRSLPRVVRASAVRREGRELRAVPARGSGVLREPGRAHRARHDRQRHRLQEPFKAACDELGIRHIKTRPYTPKTNGKAERFVQTSLREWAYARPYVSSAQREAALQPFIHSYNWHRPHSALNRQPPMSRIPAVSNLLELNS